MPGTDYQSKWDSAKAAHVARLDRWNGITVRRFPLWRTRRRRRALVALHLFGAAMMIAASLSLRPDRDWAVTGRWLGGAAIGAVTVTALRLLTGKMASGFGALLDEREREWRNRIHYTGFQTLAALMLVAMIYLLLIARQPGAGYRGAMMMSALLIFGGSVPTLVLGWQLPDDDPEDFARSDEGDPDA
ncbi:hypothetical protein [Amycolatopsis minnesotensis]|uniref:DUF2231 domain-containing protein n=1 Tax=Amycolatopsis minnesotensis TaxID=337894 RepID=A0ABP5CYY5_9PSEU